MESISKKVRRGAFESKHEGYALYKGGYVQKVKFKHTTDEQFCFFESRVKASLTRNKLYRTRVSLLTDLTCTERPQQWHIPHSNSSKDELVLLDELLVIKNNYEADKKRKKNEVRTQRKVRRCTLFCQRKNH